MTHPCTDPTLPRRRWLSWLCVGVPGLATLPAITACSTPGPPPEEVRLSLDAPPEAMAPAAPLPASPDIWQLPRTITLPDYLDRDRLLWPVDAVSLSATPAVRWAEPLREAIPRVLQHDLIACLRTPQVWLGPPPAGSGPARRLHLQVLALEVVPQRQAVRLAARWAVEAAAQGQPPAVWQADLHAPMQGPGTAAAVQAHRRVLWQWARAMAQSLST